MRSVSSVMTCILVLATGSVAAQSPAGDPDAAEVIESIERIQGGDGSRPGDEDLTCDQIGQELQAFFGGTDMTRMLAAAERADAEVNESRHELEARQEGEGAALQAAAMAETRAAAAVAMNPVAGVPAAIAAKRNMDALTQAQAVRAQQDGQEGNVALQDFKKSAADLVTNNEEQLTRMAALAKLGEEKGCLPP